MTEPDDGLTYEKLMAMVRKMDALISDDVIAVSMLFPPDKVFSFPDERGTVWAMGMARFTH